MQPVRRSARALAILAVPLLFGVGCADATGPRFDSRTPYAVFIAPPADSVPAWSDVKMVVTAVDSAEHTIEHPRLSWRSSDTLVATVDSVGVLHTRGGGYTTVRAWSSHDTAAVLVDVRTPQVATLKLPDTVRAPLLTVLKVPFQALDAQGRPVNTYLLLSDSAKLVATYVGPSVTVHTGTERLYARTTAGGTSGSTILVVGPPLSMAAFPDTLAMLVGDSARQLHTRAPWPWYGQGCFCGGPSDATSGVESWSTSDAGVASIDGTGRVTAIGAGHTTITAAAPTTGAQAKIEVYVYRYSPALSYVQVAPMTTGECARTADGRVVCSTATFGGARLYSGLGAFGTLSPSDRCETWVDSFHGPPSIFSFRCTIDPLLVDGEHQFTSIAAQPAFYVFSACGIDAGGATWCWGSQPVKQDSVPPLKLIVPFAPSPASYCGLDTTGGALCFKVGGAPTPVSGGHTFTRLAAMESVACGIDDASVSWCWGDNANGTLGDSTTTSSADPVRVHTSAPFTSIVVGGTYPIACALDSSGSAWCWGGINQVGAVSGMTSLVPKRAPTSESFTSVAVSNRLACGVTSAGSITCWDPVAGTSSFAGPAGSDWSALFSGEDHMCAVSSTGRAGCWTQRNGAVSGYVEIPRGG